MMKKPLICIILTGLFYVTPGVSNQPDNSGLENHAEVDIVAINARSPASTPAIKPHGKSGTDSRELSAFFIVGIGINVIMALTFAWWFTKEWKKNSKRKPSRND